MKLTVLTLTYGRIDRLNECLESFLRQDYPDKQMVILNTCPQQTLQGDFPNVKIINLKERPANLGSARNIAVEQADDGIICLLDDDDLALPHYLTVYAKAFADNPTAEWIWVNQQFYLEGGKIRKLAMGMCNTFAFKKAAWSKVGGYDSINVGEDRAFIGKITKQCKGVKVGVGSREIAYLYCWGNGVYHLSGLGDDRMHRVNSWQRSRLDLENRIRRGALKTGNVILNPAWIQDYSALAAEFIGKSGPETPPAGAVCIIELGRFGDIINILPVARLIAERWGKPVFMVCREFASVLNGVSYVIPHIVDFQYGDLNRAVELANRTYPVVLNAQVWGIRFNLKKETSSFNLESWRMVGFEHEFHNADRIPVFDLRNTQQEEAIYNRLADGKPMILLKLQGAVTSPFKKSIALHAKIVSHFGKTHQIVELNSVKTERICDLIGLLDRSVALLTVDTMTLHLGAASGVPTVALTNSTYWQNSLPRGNVVHTFRYNEAENNLDGVVKALAIASTITHRKIPMPIPISPPIRKIFHAVERHKEPPDKRKDDAWKSWDSLYQNGVTPCHYWNYKRDARDIGDRRALPYLKDVFQFAMEQACDDDIIFMTNDDNVLHPHLSEYLKFHVSVHGPCSGQRRELREPIPKLPHPITSLAEMGAHHAGRDLFAFTKKWLALTWDSIPDLILGASDWDWCLAALIRLHHGVKTTRENIGTSIPPCEIPEGYVLHQFHPPTWMRPENELHAPSQKHNRLLFKNWAKQHAPHLEFSPENRL